MTDSRDRAERKRYYAALQVIFFVVFISLIGMLIPEVSADTISTAAPTPEYKTMTSASDHIQYFVYDDPGIKVKQNRSLAGMQYLPGDSWNMELAGRWSYGRSLTVAAVGDTVLFPDGAYIRIVDFSIPENPMEIGRLTLPTISEQMTIEGNYAYLSTMHGGLQIVDISDLTAPVIVASIDSLIAAGEAVISGNYAYVRAPYEGLVVVDISNPLSPLEVGRYKPVDYPGSDWEGLHFLAKSGSHVYIYEDSLRVIDVSNPNNPYEVGCCFLSHSEVWDIDSFGDYVYCSNRSYGLSVVDVSDPENPQEVIVYDNPPYSVNASAIDSSYAYVCDYNGLRIYDITNPLAAFEVSFLEALSYGGGACDEIVLSGNKAYLEVFNNGIVAVDISDPANPVYLGRFETDYLFTLDAFSWGQYAYLAHDYYHGITVLSLNDYANPSRVTEIQGINYGVLDFDIDPPLLYMASMSQGLVIADLSIPENPPIVTRFSLAPNYGAHAIDVVDDIAFVRSTGSYSYLNVVDVSTPNAPVIMGLYPLYRIYEYDELAVNGDYLYALGSAEYYMDIYDVSDPNNLSFMSLYYTGRSYSSGIVAAGDLIYIAGEFGFDILNVSVSPDSPELVSHVDGIFRDVAISNGYAYLAGLNGNVSVYDLTDLSNPVLAGYHNMGYSLRSLRTWGDYVYVTDYYSGLYIYRNTLLPPTAVFINAFNADRSEDGVELSWRVTHDGDLAGFDVYRENQRFGRFEKLNPTPLSPDVTDFIDHQVEPFTTYRYKLVAIDNKGHEYTSQIAQVTIGPARLNLAQNFPNPFNPSTTIVFDVPEKLPVVLRIYDAQGRQVKTLVKGILPASRQYADWDGTNANGEPMSSGIYFYRLKAGKQALTKKMVLIR